MPNVQVEPAPAAQLPNVMRPVIYIGAYKKPYMKERLRFPSKNWTEEFYKYPVEVYTGGRADTITQVTVKSAGRFESSPPK